MKREFEYKTISIADIENNKHLLFVCDADNHKVLVERGEEWNKN